MSRLYLLTLLVLVALCVSACNGMSTTVPRPTSALTQAGDTPLPSRTTRLTNTPTPAAKSILPPLTPLPPRPPSSPLPPRPLPSPLPTLMGGGSRTFCSIEGIGACLDFYDMLNDPVTFSGRVEARSPGVSSPVVIQKVDLALGYDSTKMEAVYPTTVFSPNSTFHLVLDISQAPQDTCIVVIWTIVETQQDRDKKLREAEVRVSGSSIHAHYGLGNKQGWSAGKYKVDLYLNNSLDRTLNFEVQS